MKKIIIWSIVGILIVSIAIGAFLWLRRPQVLTLPDGTKLTLLGVEYGKHHKYPTVKLNGGGRRTGGGPASFDTPEDTLVVWILQEHKPGQWPNYQTSVCDRNETASANSWGRGNQRQIDQKTDIVPLQLQAFPRRDNKFYLRFMTYGTRGQQIGKEHFVISNPARGSFAKWTPEPVPITKSDGDLEATVTKLVAGVPYPYNRGNSIPKSDPMNKGVQIGVDFQQNGQPASNWRLVHMETSDATGNHANGWVNEYHQNGKTDGYFTEAGLWSDEPAWKLRMEFSRTTGFNEDEIWVVTNIPVRLGTQEETWNQSERSRQTNTIVSEFTAGAIHWKMFPAIQYADQNQENRMTVSLPLFADPNPEPEGIRVTLVSVTDDTGRKLESNGSSWGGGSYQYQFSNVRNVKTLNATVALHKSRFIEFTAKPSKP